MTDKQQSNIDIWLGRETPRVRKALESASAYFNTDDELTVNTLEAVYARESSFGTMLGMRGSKSAVGHFHLLPETAQRYGLSVSKDNDQRFDIDYAASAVARYLKDLDSMFSRKTSLVVGVPDSIPVTSNSERKKFVLGAYNGGEGRIATAQHLAEAAGKNSQRWSDIVPWLESAGASKSKAQEIKQYVELVPVYEEEFAQKSQAKKRRKLRKTRRGTRRCTEGHWVTIHERPVFICA